MKEIFLMIVIMLCLLIVWGILKERRGIKELEDDPNLKPPPSPEKLGVIEIPRPVKDALFGGQKEVFRIKTDEETQVWWTNQSRQVRRRLAEDLFQGKEVNINGQRMQLTKENPVEA